MTTIPCIYDSINGELRTVPAFFNNGKVYSGFTLARGIAVGTTVHPGQVLGTLQWDDGTASPLVVPDNCRGEIERFGTIRDHRVHRRPSQVFLIMRQ
ncbi:MAG: hypothetical protein MJE77_18635 [Proteobacteria bacterium]|nr:hypothetical protein [Pseudomonadota bacterium]